jgi:hypothetical protein
MKAENKTDNSGRNTNSCLAEYIIEYSFKAFVMKQMKKAGFCLHTIRFNQAHGLQKTLEVFPPTMKRRLL